MLDFSKLRLSQPSLAGSWAELGNNAVDSGHFVSVTAHATTRTKNAESEFCLKTHVGHNKILTCIKYEELGQ